MCRTRVTTDSRCRRYTRRPDSELVRCTSTTLTICTTTVRVSRAHTNEVN